MAGGFGEFYHAAGVTAELRTLMLGGRARMAVRNST